jgi:hypothetical protein
VVVKTDAQVIADRGVMTPLHRMVFARVRMLCHIVARGRTDLLVLLYAGRTAAKSWYQTVVRDLEWIAATSRKLEDMRTADIGDWVKMFSKLGTRALAPVKEALVEKAKDDAAGTAISAVPGVAVVGNEDFRCDECNLEFATNQAMRVHNARKHLKLRWARRKVRGTTCRTCLRQFATRSKLLEHLHARSPVCYVNLMLYADDLDEEVRENEDWAQWEAEAALRRRGLKTC